MEAWWKHEGENHCAILTIRAQAGLGDRTRNWRKPRKYSRSCVVVHGSFGATHNLKAAGSNPAPATKKANTIKDLKAEYNARLYSFQILVNTWSTFTEAPIEGADNRRRCHPSLWKVLPKPIHLMHPLVQDRHDADVAVR